MKDRIEKKRVEWIDFAKGITILLVIVGHSVSTGFYGATLRGVIFSFHMPLFFILSLVTYKCASDGSQFKNNIKKSCKHLLPSVIIIFIIIIIWECLNTTEYITSIEYWRGKLYSFIFASGVNTTFGNQEIAAIGIPWFFFALLFGRMIFDYIQLSFSNRNQVFAISMILGIAGVILGSTQWLPFSLDIALAIMPLFFAGDYLKSHTLNSSIKWILLAGLIWFVTFYITFPVYEDRTYLELAVRRYPLFPICYVTAISGTLFVSQISAVVCKIPVIKLPFLYIGKNSLYLLCVHMLDGIYSKLWLVPDHQFMTAIRKVIVDILVFLGFMLVRYLVKKVIYVYRLKHTTIQY